jgi:PAS domain S-box-containing protein
LSATERAIRTGRPGARLILLGVPLVALLISGLIVWHFLRDREEAIQQRAEELSTIADLKRSEIQWWLQEQVKDGHTIFGDHLGRIAAEILSPSRDPEVARQMSGSFRDWMSTLVEKSEYVAVGLVGDGNRVLVANSDVGDRRLGDYLKGLPDAHAEPGVRLLPMRRSPGREGGRLLGVHVTIRDEPHACLVSLLDPAEVLDERLRFWPTYTDTAETLLVRRAGDEVVFLNNLRHRQGTALTLRLPAGDPDLPAAQAARGREGFVRGKDYRGVPVFAAVRAIPETGWFLVVKMDQDEALAPYRAHVIPTAIAAFSVLALATLLFLFYRSRIRVRDLRLRNELESRYRLMVESTRDGISILNERREVVFANGAALRLFGYREPAEMISRSFETHLTKEDRKCLDDVLAPGRNGGDEIGVREFTARRADGSSFRAEMCASRVRWDGLDLSPVAVRDVTARHETMEKSRRLYEEKRELESQLAQAQRLESVGRLAGGIAHDFNNLLTVIGGFASIVAADLDPDHGMQEKVGEIERATNRAADLVRQLLAFSRRQVLEPEVLDLNGILRDMEQMLIRLIGEDVLLRTTLSPELPPILADPAQVEQVVLNLVVNARDAMPRGGKIHVRTEDVILDAGRASDLDVPPGRYARLSVLDTGEGMSEEVRTRVFEPFFTTKEIGKGTGLGLSTVYGIVKQSRGGLDVRSEKTKGTTFDVFLPASQGEPERSEKEISRDQVAGGDETILLAEDETGVREFVAEVLTEVGYRLIRASDGPEAAKLAKEHSGRIDLLLTDVVMPGLGGADLYEAIARDREGIRVLYMSGYAERGTPGSHDLPPGVPLLRKPFGPDELLRRVRTVLSATPPPSKPGRRT